MNKKRILFISWYYFPKVGGAETVAKTISKGLKEKGFYVEILTSSEKESFDFVDGIKVTRTPHLLPSKKISRSFRNFLKEKILSCKFNIVHCHNISYPFNPEKSLAIIKICNNFGIPIIEHSHNAQLKKPEKTRKIILSDLDKIICVSDFVKRRLIKLGVDKNKLIRIYNPLDYEKFSNKKIDYNEIIKLKRKISPEGNLIIFFPGRVIRISKMEIGEQKQFKVVVNALKILKKRRIKFKLAFPGLKAQPNFNERKISAGNSLIRNYFLKQGLDKDYFMFNEALTPDNMPLAYAAADVVCIPSLNEAFGMVFVESQAMQKPIIAAKSGAATEVISSKAGFFISPGDESALAGFIEKLIKNNKLLKKLGVNGRKNVIKKFSEKKILDEIISLYDEISMEKIYLVRHPETMHNKRNKLAGWENSNYTKEGEKQFKKIVKFFEGKKEKIYSSNLGRCLKLAKAITKENNSALFISKLLRERNFKQTKPYSHFETKEDFKERVRRFLKNYEINNSIIISHAGVMKEIITEMLNEREKNAEKIVCLPRDNIFLIETNKKHKILKIIRV